MATIGLTGGAGATGGININGTERVTIDTSGNVTLTSGGVDVANVASINGTFPSGFKNKIIGGDFTVNPWQRGTSFTAPASTAYTADRFRIGYSMDGVVNVLKTADAPTAVQAGVYTQHCLHVDVTTADASIAAGQYCIIGQRVEGLNAASFGFGQSGTRYVTLSFWHKHTKTGTYCVALMNEAGTRSYVAEYVQDTTDTWEKATLTIPVDTTGTWLYTTGIGVNVEFAIAAGSTYQTTAGAWAAGLYLASSNQVNALDSTANNFKIALVQLEAAPSATFTGTPFETRSAGQELALCQRYYYRIQPSGAEIAFGSAYASTTTIAFGVGKFPVTMRTRPTSLEQSGVASNYNVQFTADTVCSSVPTFQSAGDETWRVRFTVASGLTAGQGGMAWASAAGTYLAWSAEL